MIKETIIQTRINGANRKHYEALGYTGAHNELIDIDPKHLPTKSNVIITAICMDCGNERKTKFNQYREYCPCCATKGERHHNYSKERHVCACGKPKSRGTQCWECYTAAVHNPDAVKRSNSDYRWSLEVKEIANYECDCCKSNEDLCSHHLESFDNNESLRRDVTNGVCLCRTCHLTFHKVYGFGSNTKEQYTEFKENQYGSN